MKTRKFFMKSMLILLGIVLVSSFASAAVLAEWPLTSGCAPTNVASSLTAGNLIAGPGLTDFNNCNSSTLGAFAKNWPTTSTPNFQNDYFEITLAPTTGNKIIISSLEFIISSSSEGPQNYEVQYSLNSDFSNPQTLGGTRNAPTTEEIVTINMNAEVQPGQTIRIRWAGFNANSSSGTLRLKTISVEGVITAIPIASLQLTKTQELTLAQNGKVEVKNTGNVVIQAISLFSSGAFATTFSPSSPFTLSLSQTQILDVIASGLDELKFGIHTITVKAIGRDTSNNNVTSNEVTFTVEKSFCRNGPAGGNLTIERVSIDNNGEGDDNSWILLDDLTLEVRVANDGNDDIKDVIVKLGLFDSSGRNFVGDLKFSSKDEEEIDLGKINDGKDETATFEFQVPADMEPGSYKLSIKAYSDDLGESVECADSADDLSNRIFESVDVDTQDDEGKFIAFDKIVLIPSQATCSEIVTLTTDVYNVGEDDQDQVKVNLRSAELGLDKSFEIRKDLDAGSGDKETVNFQFTIPAGLADRIYSLRLSAEYDYRNGIYREISDEDTIIPLSVVGCSPVSGRIASISASLDSESIAGGELVVKATITSLRNERSSFAVNAKNFESWARLDDISSRVFELNAGESKEVTFRFTINDDAEGTESFDVEVLSADRTETTEVVVNVRTPQGRSGITGLAGLNLEGNSLLWIIGIINVILIVLIIVIAFRIARR